MISFLVCWVLYNYHDFKIEQTVEPTQAPMQRLETDFVGKAYV